jgi:hypothetical protein
LGGGLIMPIGINGSGSITGISAGGLPDGSITPADLSQPLTLGTAQASTSGTAIDFTGIPSWVKRVTVMFNGVSTNGTSLLQVQIGAGSFATSGYTSQYSTNGLSGSLTSGFIASYRPDAGNAIRGLMSICLVTGNTYVVSSVLGAASANNDITSASGGMTLSGTLDRIRITTVNGTDAFDAGSINILYE